MPIELWRYLANAKRSHSRTQRARQSPRGRGAHPPNDTRSIDILYILSFRFTTLLFLLNFSYLYQNQDSMDTAQVLELNLAAYKQHGNDQIKQAAQEIESLFNTPA